MKIGAHNGTQMGFEYSARSEVDHFMLALNANWEIGGLNVNLLKPKHGHPFWPS
jgi:hypothetical protein